MRNTLIVAALVLTDGHIPPLPSGDLQEGVSSYYPMPPLVRTIIDHKRDLRHVARLDDDVVNDEDPGRRLTH